MSKRNGAIRILPPDGSTGSGITPGGGLEPGESREDGLRRELREALGLERFEIGPLAWRCDHTFNWADRRIHQREEYHLVQVARFEPDMSDAVEAKALDRFQGWPLAELPKSRGNLKLAN